MRDRLSYWLSGWRFWLLLGLLLIAAGTGIATWYNQQPNDAQFVIDSSSTSTVDRLDRPGPIQLPMANQSPAEAQAESVARSIEVDPATSGCANDVQGVVIPTLDVSATTVPIGLDDEGVLGAPSHADRMAIGVYTAGSMPGEPGNTLINGHTYAEGESVFDYSFGQDLQAGDSITLANSNCLYSYRVVQMWPNLAKDKQHSSATTPLFADVVNQQDLFRQDGPSGLVVMTCAGEFDYVTRHHQDEAVAYALLVDVTVI